MEKLKILWFTPLVITLLSCVASPQAESFNHSLVAIQGYDLVSYHKGERPLRGNGNHVATHAGVNYLFINKKNKATFEANPTKYLPAYGGYCAYGVAVSKKFIADPEIWELVEGRLYLNLDNKIRGIWAKDIAGNLKKANKNWPKIQDKNNFVGVQGYDLVSYHKGARPLRGNGNHVATYAGVNYLFINKKNKATFEANPTKYLPAYGGYCAYGVAVGKKFIANPEIWELVEGQLYLNLDNKIRGIWGKEIAKNLKKANKNWQEIRNKKPSEL